MDLNTSFEQIWQSTTDFEFILPEPEPNWCSYARAFAQWSDQLRQATETDPQIDVLAVNRAMLILTRQYFKWRNAVPKLHRDCLGSSSHVCVYTVFVQTHERLQALELTLTPPLLFKPVSSPPPLVAGLYMGEKGDDWEELE